MSDLAANSLDAILDRLDRLETAQAAQTVGYRYAQAIDTLDFKMLAGVFAPDASLTTRRGTRRSREAIIEYYREALSAPVARRHFIVNQQVTWLAPGEALMRSSFIYTFAGDATSILGWGGYVDRVEIQRGVGIIVEKTITVDVHADVRTGWADPA